MSPGPGAAGGWRPAAWEALFLLAVAAAPLAGGGSGARHAVLLAALVWAAFFLRLQEREALPRTLAGACLAGFVGLAAASALGSVYPGHTLETTARYATWFAGFLLAADLARRGKGGPVALALLAGGVVAALYGLSNYAATALVDDNPAWREFSRFENPNLFASFLLLAAPVGLSAFLAARDGRLALLAGLAALALFLGLLVTGSRGAVLCAGPAALIWLGFWLRRGMPRPPAWLPRLALLGAIALAAGALASEPLRGRALDVTDVPLPEALCPLETRGATEDSNRFRLLTWAGTVDMLRARPLLGYGAGTFEYAYPRHAQVGFTRRAHQSYLEYGAEAGVGALLLWLLALALAGWGLLRRKGPHPWYLPGVAAALAASAAHNLVDWGWSVPGVALPFWALLGLAVASDSGPAAPEGRPPWRTGLALAGGVLCAAALLLAGLAEARALAGGDRARQGDLFAARAQAERAVLLAPWRAEHHADLARLQQALGSEADAARSLVAARRRSPAWARPYLQQAWLDRAQGDPAAALAALEAGLRHNPLQTDLLWTRAEILLERDDPAAARAALERLAEIEEGPVGQVRALAEVRDWRFPLARLELGWLHERAGEAGAAQAQLRRAACALAERRFLLTLGEPKLEDVRRASGTWNLAREVELRRQEVSVWSWLASRFRAAGDEPAAAAAEEQERLAAEDLHRLEEEAHRGHIGG